MIFRHSHRKAINENVIILARMKMNFSLAESAFPQKEIKNMHTVCHGCNTKIAAQEEKAAIIIGEAGMRSS